MPEITPNSTPEERAEAEVRAITESETSPAMLLASGFIAGGSLGGVLNACLNFFPDEWQKVYNFVRRSWTRSSTEPRSHPSVAQQLIALVIFLGLAAVLLAIGFGKPVEPAAPPPRIGDVPETGFRVDE